MNESHAQFFRELRELCEKHDAEIRIRGDAELQIDIGSPSCTSYYDRSFDAFTKRFDKVLFMDTPQKEGEK